MKTFTPFTSDDVIVAIGHGLQVRHSKPPRDWLGRH
jgi:hypothetical protein